LDAGAEPDAGGGRTAQLLGEPVVPAAAADCVLGRLEGVGRELERRARVVVEAADEPGLDRVGDAEGGESLLYAFEVRLAGIAQVVDLVGRGGGHREALGAFAVEDAPRVVGDAVAVLTAALVPPLLEMG